MSAVLMVLIVRNYEDEPIRTPTTGARAAAPNVASIILTLYLPPTTVGIQGRKGVQPARATASALTIVTLRRRGFSEISPANVVQG